MNNSRRKDIAALVQRLRNLKEDSQILVEAFELDGLVEDATDLHSAEEEYLENMPEGLKAGEKGETASAAIDSLDTARTSIEEFQTEFTELLDKLDEICDSLENSANG